MNTVTQSQPTVNGLAIDFIFVVDVESEELSYAWGYEDSMNGIYRRGIEYFIPKSRAEAAYNAGYAAGLDFLKRLRAAVLVEVQRELQPVAGKLWSGAPERIEHDFSAYPFAF